MWLGIVTLLLMLMPAVGTAQEAVQPSASTFRSLASEIPGDPSVAGQWVVLLPAIARRCRMTLDLDRVTSLVNGFAAPNLVDDDADYFAARGDFRLRAIWEWLAGLNEADACRLADSLWGEHGTSFAGVLHEGSPRF